MTALTRADLKSNITSDIADNISGQISAEDVRQNMLDQADSAVFLNDSGVVQVGDASDFPAPVSGVITLETDKVYQINGSVSIGTDRIAINGSSGIFGTTQARDHLIYTGTGNMFTSGAGENIDVKRLEIECPNGFIVNFVGDGLTDVVRFNDCIFRNVNAMGNVEDAFFFQLNQCLMQNVVNGFTFTGTSGGRFNVTGCSIINTTNTTLALGTAIYQNYLISANQSIVTPLGGTFLSGAVSSANVGIRGIISSNAFSGVGDVLNGITTQDQLWTSASNFGLIGTMVDAELYVSTPAETTIATDNTPVLVAGTYTEVKANCFTITSGGRATYDGADAVDVKVTAFINADMTSAGAKECNFYIAKNGLIISSSSMGNTLEANALKFTAAQALSNLVTNDYIEVFVENTSDTANIQANKLTIIITRN